MRKNIKEPGKRKQFTVFPGGRKLLKPVEERSLDFRLQSENCLFICRGAVALSWIS